MSKIFISHPIPDPAMPLLTGKGYDVSVGPADCNFSKDELLGPVKGVDALVSLLTDKVNGEVMDAAGPSLKIIANYAVGVDNIDLAAAKARGITVTNTPGVLTEAVAEHAFALLMAVARRIPESDQFMRQGKYKGWRPMLLLGSEVHGKTLGIVGLGRIGTYLAKMAYAGFGMRIRYYDVKPNTEFEKEFNAMYKTLPELLAEADFISIHVPLLPTTKHLVGANEFAMMKKTAYLINTSRGPVVDEAALVQALNEGRIAGAALDVFENEPAMAPGLSELANVVLTPHTASATLEARSAMARIAAENVIAFFDGKTPPNVVG